MFKQIQKLLLFLKFKSLIFKF